MTNAHTPTEKSKKHHDNIKNATKNFDYTTIGDRLNVKYKRTDAPSLWHRPELHNNRAPQWTFMDPCKPEVRPGAREESASPAWLAAPAMNARDTTEVYIWRLDKNLTETGKFSDISVTKNRLGSGVDRMCKSSDSEF